MTRITLAPAGPTARTRPRPALLRPRKPLSSRELKSVFARVKKRILKGGEPFALFAMKHGRGRVFQLIGHSSPEYKVQMRVNEAREHLVAVYDGSAHLGDVWDDLTSFDQPAAPVAAGRDH